MFLAFPALNKLFGRDVATIGFAGRCNATDHLAMCPSPGGPPTAYVIHGTAAADYDRPIAVLVGPGAVSSGDQVAHLFRFHPRARFFGKSTATAFNAPIVLTVGTPVWSARLAIVDAYRPETWSLLAQEARELWTPSCRSSRLLSAYRATRTRDWGGSVISPLLSRRR